MTPEYFKELKEHARRSMAGHTADRPGVYVAEKPRTNEERAMADGVLTGFILAGAMWCESMTVPSLEFPDLGLGIDAVSDNITLT